LVTRQDGGVCDWSGAVGCEKGTLVEAKAQTILQLFSQLQVQGYSDEELGLIHRAYELLVRICASQYRSSGRTVIDHAIGMTSLLASCCTDPQLVAAGVTHPVYLHGDFGTFRKRILPGKRRMLREAVGSAVEELVFRYSLFDWSPQAMPSIRDRVRSGEAATRAVVLMRLADQLDIYGEHDALYCHNASKRRVYARDSGPSVVALAQDLELSALAAALRRAFIEVGNGTPPGVLTEPAWRDGPIIPRSYRVRVPIALYQSARYRLYRMLGR
jgi:(p)ppGpp synthase/HD superfamily hydrolase